ncbi:5523_t:CDS:2 [Entrophospora sp. SA101]|nr:5523_t:CDS:2 [Entrophospora sp. SA101]
MKVMLQKQLKVETDDNVVTVASTSTEESGTMTNISKKIRIGVSPNI